MCRVLTLERHFYCAFNISQGTDRTTFKTHIAVGLATFWHTFWPVVNFWWVDTIRISYELPENCHWRKLAQLRFLSQPACVCRDNRNVLRVLSRQQTFCTCHVALTNMLYVLCGDNRHVVRVLSRNQTCTCLVATKIVVMAAPANDRKQIALWQSPVLDRKKMTELLLMFPGPRTVKHSDMMFPGPRTVKQSDIMFPGIRTVKQSDMMFPGPRTVKQSDMMFPTKDCKT